MPHTPAPWHIAKDGDRIYHVTQLGIETIAHLVNGVFYGAPEDEHLSNAHLIAAAPALLAACEAAAALIDKLENDWMHTTPEGQALRAAIAQARGD